MDVDVQDRLEGQVALVTGGNRGMGAVIAANLASLGARVFIGVRDPATVDAPEGITPVRMDVTDEASVASAFQHLRDAAGRLDILVNNAGIAPGIGQDVTTEPLDQFDQVMATNLRGPFTVTKHAVPLLLERPGGRIVNMSSGMGSLSEGVGGQVPAYSISKAALNALTVHTHEAFHARGLIVNCVCPGWVRTDMGGPEADRSPEEGAATPTWLARFAPGAPSGRFWRDRAVIDW